MAKQTKTYRLSDTTIGKVNELAKVFNESGADTIARAINFLDTHRELAAKLEYERISQTGGR